MTFYECTISVDVDLQAFKESTESLVRIRSARSRMRPEDCITLDAGDDTVITDTIADTLHLAHSKGMDIQTILRRAVWHFINETNETDL